ncbi:MAG: iron-containing alcohol dehydrogenase [Rhodothermaceae bacterium]|nr:iron-containing alcohol dehydrogenase [Rhodothermaceae bacterium]
MPFRLPTRVHFGSKTLDQLAPILESYGHQRILLVTDAGLQSTKWPGYVTAKLKDHLFEVTVVDSIEPNPRHSTIDETANLARHADIELVVGLGGGSVLDAGKAIAMLLNNEGSILSYEGKNRFFNGSAPFIAIPSTCGTGSEVTWVSVITNPDEERKLSIKGDAMFPNEAIVDPDILKTLPASLIAYTGMDAYTHAIEAYTCNCGNPFSDALAEKAISLLDNYLVRAFLNIEDTEARREVMRAATVAGMAFGNADVAGVHCLSESIGGVYDIPHGLANSILLHPVLSSHQSIINHKLSTLYTILYPQKAQSLGTEHASQAMLESILFLTSQLDIPPFSALSIPVDDYPRIASLSATNNSNGSNPRTMHKSDYLAILQSL